jgi:CheY-like chemotaxis protein
MSIRLANQKTSPPPARNEFNWQAVLDRLDQRQGANPRRNRRRQPRVPFRRADVTVEIMHPGGSSATRPVFTRDLSAGGIACLHNGFVHTGTKVQVRLPRRLGGIDHVGGVVVHCWHVQGTWHQVDVRFNNRIFPKLYVDPEHWAALDSRSGVDPASLKGNILIVDDQSLDRRLLEHHLHATGMKADAVGGVAETLTYLSAGNRPDVVLCDLVLAGGQTALDAIKAMRQHGYKGPIALVTAETTPARLKPSLDAGAATVLHKPFEPAALFATLHLCLTGCTEGGGGEEPLYSDLASRTETAVLLQAFVDEARHLADQLREAAKAGNHEHAREICVTLKGNGAGYGYTPVSEAAGEAVKSLDATMSTAESAVQIERLIGVCRRLTATMPPQG